VQIFAASGLVKREVAQPGALIIPNVTVEKLAPLLLVREFQVQISVRSQLSLTAGFCEFS
jgi:hypothetical protein